MRSTRDLFGATLLVIAIFIFLPVSVPAADSSDREDVIAPRLKLPPLAVNDHSRNAILDLGTFNLSAQTTSKVHSGRLIKLEASYNEAISLKDALVYTINHNLPIQIARESSNYQRYQMYSYLAGFVPSLKLGYDITRSTINPERIKATSDVFTAQVTYNVFEGGSVVYNSLAQAYRNRGWKHAYESNINDALLQTYNNYMNLVLQNSLLRIKARAVQISKSNLELNKALYKAGIATQFNVMQSQTQLALDNEEFIQQEMNARQAALALAYNLNAPLGINLIPEHQVLTEENLIRTPFTINELLNIAINTRPEIKQYEMFRLAAARTIQTTAASYYPTVAFFTAYNFSNVQDSDDDDSSSSTLENAGIFSGLTRNWQAGFTMSWSLSNMGLLNTANVVSAKALSRQAMMQANQELQKIIQQVRSAYDTMLISTNRIDAAAEAASAAREALRLAHLRLKSGLGTNLELIQAQKSYINTLSSHAKAIIDSNKAQAQVLYSTGLISVENLTDGYSSDAQPFKKKKQSRLFKFW